MEVKAEAFEVQCTLQFQTEGKSGIDFGTFRVGQVVENLMVVVNNGKYPVRYEFKIRKKWLRSILKIDANNQEELKPQETRVVSSKCIVTKEIKVRLLTVFLFTFDYASLFLLFCTMFLFTTHKCIIDSEETSDVKHFNPRGCNLLMTSWTLLHYV